MSGSWPAIRAALLELVRHFEVPVSRPCIVGADRLLIIGTCLGVPYAEVLASRAITRETAVVASCQFDELGAGCGSGSRIAGSVEKNVLPDAWADCIVGHCVLDELDAPFAAFAELARTAADLAPLCISGPVSKGPVPVRLRPGGKTTFRPEPSLIDDLVRSGFGSVRSRDLTSELLPRLREAGFGEWWPPEARWVMLQANRVARGQTQSR